MDPLNNRKPSRAHAEADFAPQLVLGSRISLEKQLVRAVRSVRLSRLPRVQLAGRQWRDR
jgi:hypothetical protein